MNCKHPGTSIFYLNIFSALSLLAMSLGCKQDDFKFDYSSSKNPAASLELGSGQTVYTQNRNVSLHLNSESPYQMAFFINTSCVYKEAKDWESYASVKNLQLPDEDGIYNIGVIYRTADHFPSECKTVKVVLDRVGPKISTVQLSERMSSTLATPSFSFEAAKDAFSAVTDYQARVLNAGNDAVILDWTTISSVPGAANALSVAMAGGYAYVVEVRARDNAGNFGAG